MVVPGGGSLVGVKFWGSKVWHYLLVLSGELIPQHWGHPTLDIKGLGTRGVANLRPLQGFSVRG